VDVIDPAERTRESLEREVRHLRADLASLEAEIAASRRKTVMAGLGLAGTFVGVLCAFLACSVAVTAVAGGARAATRSLVGGP
jgi:hypothetical protein